MSGDLPDSEQLAAEPGDTVAFIVRIWREAMDGDGHTTSWRGSIERVGSGHRLYFSELAGIARFIREELGLKTRLRLVWPPFTD